jgi:hypothetical protein
MSPVRTSPPRVGSGRSSQGGRDGKAASEPLPDATSVKGCPLRSRAPGGSAVRGALRRTYDEGAGRRRTFRPSTIGTFGASRRLPGTIFRDAPPSGRARSHGFLKGTDEPGQLRSRFGAGTPGELAQGRLIRRLVPTPVRPAHPFSFASRPSSVGLRPLGESGARPRSSRPPPPERGRPLGRSRARGARISPSGRGGGPAAWRTAPAATDVSVRDVPPDRLYASFPWVPCP